MASSNSDSEKPRFSKSAPSKAWRVTKLNERMYRALKSEQKADVSVIIGDETIIRCHSLILSFASPKLDSMLPNQELRLYDVEPSHFRLLLEIIYCGDTDVPMDFEQTIQVGRAAHNLEVQAAVHYCTERLGKFMTADNVCQILDFAREVCDASLMDSCWEMILENTSAVLKAASFVKCEHMTLDMIVREERLGPDKTCTELLIFQACGRWAAAHADDFGSSREALGSALYQIRFLTISAPDLVEHVFPTGILTEREEHVIFRCVTTDKDVLPNDFSRNKHSRAFSSMARFHFGRYCSFKSKEIYDGFFVENPLRITVSSDSYIDAVALYSEESVSADSGYGWIGEILLRDSSGTVLTSIKFNSSYSAVRFERKYAIFANTVYELQVHYRNPSVKPKARLIEEQILKIARINLRVLNSAITSIKDVRFSD